MWIAAVYSLILFFYVPESKNMLFDDDSVRLLIRLRSQRNDLFAKTRNQFSLWKNITAEINNQKVGVDVSAQQVMNKWKSLKREWRKVIDYNSLGRKKKTCKFFDEFTKIYSSMSPSNSRFTLFSGTPNKEQSDNPYPRLREHLGKNSSWMNVVTTSLMNH